jgi:hypothetical protein
MSFLSNKIKAAEAQIEKELEQMRVHIVNGYMNKALHHEKNINQQRYHIANLQERINASN